jgi:hypothetical protein
VELVKRDQRRAVAHSSEFGCPNGLNLLSTEAEIRDLHCRCLPAADEAQVISEIYLQQSRDADATKFMQDAAQLSRVLREIVPKTLLGARLLELNVLDELRHRYADSDQLGAVFRERDIEAYERLPLVDQDAGTLVRLIGVDGSRLEWVRSVLHRHQVERSTRYLPVDTQDRQRLTFMQVRAVFPFSDWRGFAIARTHYAHAHMASESEKHHILPGNRFLPNPGAGVSEDDMVGLLVRAWVLERLNWTQDEGWVVLPAGVTESAIAVGPTPLIAPQLAYRLAVDLVSSTSCFVRQRGPAALRQRLAAFTQAQSNGTNLAGLKLLPSTAPLTRAVKQLQVESSWWERNCHSVVLEANGSSVR